MYRTAHMTVIKDFPIQILSATEVCWPFISINIKLQFICNKKRSNSFSEDFSFRRGLKANKRDSLQSPDIWFCQLTSEFIWASIYLICVIIRNIWITSLNIWCVTKSPDCLPIAEHKLKLSPTWQNKGYFFTASGLFYFIYMSLNQWKNIQKKYH